MRHLAFIAFCLQVLAPLTLVGQSPSTPLQVEIQTENTRIQDLWKAKKYEEGLKVLTARSQSPSFSQLDANTRAGVHYNMACAAALLGRGSEALAWLGVAVGEGFKDWANLEQDSDLASIRNEPGFKGLAETARRQGDFVWVLRGFKDYGLAKAMPFPAFTYQAPNHADLVKFREAWKLDEIAGKGPEFERILNLVRWVHTQVRHDGNNSINPEPKNALHILEVCRTEKRGVNCRMMATILNEAYLATGFKSRQVTCRPLDEKDPDCHVITTVWSNQFGKWLYMDPTFDAYFTDEKGTPQSISEVRDRLISGAPLRMAEGANWNGQPYDSIQYKNYMAKNLVRIICPTESAFGFESKPGTRTYVILDALGFPHRPGDESDRVTNDPLAFWAKP